MIRTLALTNDSRIKIDVPLDQLETLGLKWYWVDFNCPSDEESVLLEDHFHFHHLAVEDCLHVLQRPKVDCYGGYNFFVLHALKKGKLSAEEIDLFVGTNFIVSYHQAQHPVIEEVWLKLSTTESTWQGSYYICYSIMDKLVDCYFPAAYDLEDKIDEIEDNSEGHSIGRLMDKVFEVRSDILKLRRTVNQMKDLLYRILNSTELEEIKSRHLYFSDIYDHLLRLSEMLESSQAMTSEIRDNYLSINAHRMNKIMMLLTVITTIFIPLTFIVGIYGMNFKYMPELDSKYGYFITLGTMALMGVLMFYWFKRKGWFDLDK